MSKTQYANPSVEVHNFRTGGIICSSPLDSNSANTSGFILDNNYNEME